MKEKILKLFILLNYIYFVKSSLINRITTDDEEGSGMYTDIKTRTYISDYEKKVSNMEQKLNSLTEYLYQLRMKVESNRNEYEGSGTYTDVTSRTYIANNEEKFASMEEKLRLLSENFNEFQIKMEAMMNDNVNKMANEIKLISNLKEDYQVHEVNCPNNRTPRDCYEINECNSNIYSIMVPEASNKSFNAYCDLKTLDGGWTVIQRRQDASVDFYRNWNDYVEGFGDINGNFFIGLEKLYALTSLGKPQELYITLKDFDGVTKYARYEEFKVGSKSTNYTLTVSKYFGNAGDSLSKHSGHKFSTKDRENDNSTLNCAVRWKGGWWYHNCYSSNLNGMFLMGQTDNDGRAMSWGAFRGVYYALKFVEMKIRSKE